MAAPSPAVRPAYTIQVADSQELVQACYDVRIEVFVVEQGFSHDDEIDEYDPQSIHFLLTTPLPSPPPVATSSLTPNPATAGGTTEYPIGTIRFVPGKNKLTRLAVQKEYRQYGFGKVLVEALETFVKENAVKQNLGAVYEEGGKKWIDINCHSQLYVIPFYTKFGYVAEGPQFDEDGAPHQLLIHKLQVD
ncbi:hypothetical protein I350_07689 [Cryptococcus amylolentus CBS 6273]|uniref:N-acetyltransferase domain-containing protein n=1 Tax=Cryptococcus amylolentus CBS 6273 TaxID=1296118 RepID=A0A1E3JB22_9TREE|nr:hypothetical protein I350_07689 [Cryptococcus amylolentus CBS 6273]